jgi:hypothetical protein
LAGVFFPDAAAQDLGSRRGIFPGKSILTEKSAKAR